MRILQPEVGRADIDASIRTARFEGHDPARWALPLVAAVDERCNGRWSLVSLTLEEADDLWLPPHAGEPCHGDSAPLAGGAGGTLTQCVAWLELNSDVYARANRSCWNRIQAARAGLWGPLVAAPFGVGDRVGPATHMVVIDGLHRALGWALRDGRAPVEVFLAGPDASTAAGSSGR